MLGLYALSVMDRDGPIYGYSLADRIAERTDGGWRPGAGAIYPALQSLVEKGWARSSPDGRRRVYAITAIGRGFLARVRRGWMGAGRGGPDLSMMWSEIAGEADVGQHMLRHLRRHLDSIVSYIERDPAVRSTGVSLSDLVLAELRITQSRLDSMKPGSSKRTTRPRRGRA